MYRNISGMTEAQWNDAVTNAGRYVLTKAVFNGDTTLYGDGTDGAVVSIKFDEQMENANGLSMGGTIASQCKVEIRQPSTPISLVNSTFVPYVGLKDSANREGYVPLGEFFATSADSNSNGGVVSVVGYDRFCKLEVPYEPTVSFPTTTTAIMADLAANRFTFSGTITDRPIDEFRVGTVKDWIGWLAGLEGKNARFNRDGQLEFVYYDITQYDYTVDRENQYMAGVNTKTADNVTINAITSGTEENPIVSGNGRSITFSNPYMTQEILDDIRNTGIVDSLTEVSGDLITVDAIEAPAKSVEMNIEPTQNLNGYDHPWVGGAGKNLCYGVAGQNNVVVAQCKSGVTYTFSLHNTGSMGFNLKKNSQSGTTVATTGAAVQTSTVSVTFTADEDFDLFLNGYGANGDTFAGVTSQFQLEVGSPATAYAPYENICPIYPANGKNLLPKGVDRTSSNITYSVQDDGTVIANGTASATSFWGVRFTIPSGTYTYNGCPSGGGASTYYFDIRNALGGSGIAGTGSDTGRGRTFTITEPLTAWLNIRIASGFVANNLVFKPMLRHAEIIDPAYVPYNAIEITRAGKNLIDLANIQGSSGSIFAEIALPPGTYYTYQFTQNMNHNMSWQYLLDGNAITMTTAGDEYAKIDYSSDSYNRGKNKITLYQKCTIRLSVQQNSNTASYPVDVMLTTDGTGYSDFPTSGDTSGYKASMYEPYTAEHYYSQGTQYLPLNPGDWTTSTCATNGYANSTTRVAPTAWTIPFKEGHTYTVDMEGSYESKVFNCGVNEYDSSGTRTRDFGWKTMPFTFTVDSGTTTLRITFRASDDSSSANYINLIGTQIKFKMTESGVSSPVVPFGKDVYGGTLDVVSGVLTVDKKIVVFDGTNIGFAMASTTSAFYSDGHATDGVVGEVLSNQYPYGRVVNVAAGSVPYPYTVCVQALNGVRFVIYNPTYTTANAFNAYLNNNPLQVIYSLATPQTYQLTPAQVELLKGTNNIWADGDSTLNIIYLATPRANMSFRPMELQWRGNPCVQCGDRIFVETESNSLTTLVMAHTLSIEGGMNDVIKCFGSSDAEVALDKSPMEKKISTAYNALQSAIQDATALLNGTRGGIFEITKENGINTGWLIKESASPNYMGNVIVANYNGIGFSTDGGATYGTAITTDGHINGQYITAHSVDVEALSVGNTSDPFSNYVYIGRRRPNDDNTDMVIRIGVASQSMVQEMRGNRTSIYKTEDVQAYVNGSLTDAELDARALMYYSDTDYVLLNLGSFRIGGMLMQAQANGGVKFIKAE